MATLGSFDVPIYVKSDGKFVEIGSASFDVHGELCGDTVKLSVESPKEYLPLTDTDHLLREVYKRPGM